MASSFVICGYYKHLIIFTSLIIVHELGHYVTAKAVKFKVEKIIIYPYGGITKLDDIIDKNITNEVLVAISGIIVQQIFFYLLTIIYKNNYINVYTYNIICTYNKEIIMFNILPIHPLDGSKILNLLINKVINYNSSNKITLYISTITLLFIIINNLKKNNYSSIMTYVVLLYYVYKFKKELKYYNKKLMLEKYLYNNKFKKTTIIENNNFYKNRNHIIKLERKYYKEKDYLKKYFKS